VGTYSVALQSLSNLDTPYVFFQVGIPEMGTNEYVYDLPFVRFTSNVRGAPDVRPDVAWATIDSTVNTTGTVLAPGYLFDEAANGFAGFSFNLATYPGLREFYDRIWETVKARIYAMRPDLKRKGNAGPRARRAGRNPPGMTDMYNQLAEIPGKCQIPFVPFRFHLVAAATAMTRDEFIAHATGEAETLRQAILKDNTGATPGLLTLAADRNGWRELYLTALQQAGLLRAEDALPQIRDQQKVVSTMATLASGILIGPAGQQILSSGNLPDFFDRIRAWYGHDESLTYPDMSYEKRRSDCYEGGIPVPAVSTFDQYDLGLSSPTHFESFRVYVPWIPFQDRGAGLPADFQVNGPQPVDGSAFSPLDLTRYLQGNAGQGLASITGPQTVDTGGWLPLKESLPYTVNFANASTSTQRVAEVRIVTPLDENLDVFSFRLGDIKIGRINVHVPRDRALFQGDFDFAQTLGFVLRVSAGVDQYRHEATWLLQAIDPLTGELLQDPTKGLLPPNNAQGDGAGFVSYTILPDHTTAVTGNQVKASARVFYNNAPPEDTPELVHRIDVAAPVTATTVTRVSEGSNNYVVQWSSTDGAGGSGFQHVTLYVATDGGMFKIWQKQLTSPSGSTVFQGQAGHTYQFLALATDKAGNRETPGATVRAEDDGSRVNIGAPPSVPGTTPANFGIPRAPTATQPSTNWLFTEAERRIPNAPVTVRAPEYRQVLAPFTARAFARGIEPSNAGIGPLAIAETPEGDILVSGGPTRGWIYRFTAQGGDALTPWAEVPYPIFNLAFDHDGRLWATTGGGPLLELDPVTGEMLGEYGDGITMALAVEPSTGLIYVARGAVWSGGVNGAGGGVEVFDPATRTFTRYSKDLNLRVASLAFAPDGTLWATSWPDRRQVVKFTPQHRAEVVLTFDADIDSLAFGQPGTDLEGLLFVSQNAGGNSFPGSELTMVDLASLRRVAVADGGSRGDVVITTRDGRVLVSQSHQVDALSPAATPVVLATNPPEASLVALPLSLITVTFDQDMFVGEGTEAGSAVNPANFALMGRNSGPASLQRAFYAAEGRTVSLLFSSLPPDDYALTVSRAVTSIQGSQMTGDYTTTFSAVSEFSGVLDIRFTHSRSDRAQGTVSWDVQVTNRAAYDIWLPLVLVLDPAQGYEGVPQAASGRAPDGRWFIDLSAQLPDGQRLAPGESTIGRTLTIFNSGDRRIDFTAQAGGAQTANQAPVFQTTPPTQAQIGQPYVYLAEAQDADSEPVFFFLASGPQDMTVDAVTGRLTWTPPVSSPARARVVLAAYDTRGGRSEQVFDIAVQGGNRAPYFGPLVTQVTGVEGTEINLSFSLIDPDGDPLAFWADRLPPGATLDPATYRFIWTPAFGTAATYKNVTFHASDGISETAMQFTFAIAPTDQPPVFVDPGDRTLREGDHLRFYLHGYDPDGEPVTFVSPLLPPGATLDPNTGLFEWTPDYYMAGTYEVPFTVRNGRQRVTQTTTFTVLNANGPPAFHLLGNFRVYEGQHLVVAVPAFDPDNPGYEPPYRNAQGELVQIDVLSASVTIAASNLPPGAAFDPDTTLLTWQPDYDQAGTYQITFTATDNGDGTGVPLTAVTTLEVTVLDQNRGPEIEAVPNQTVRRGQVLDIAVRAIDLDLADPITLQGGSGSPGYPLPDFVTFTDNGDGTGVFHVAPVTADRGDYSLVVTAADGDGGGSPDRPTSSYTFILTVVAENEPPVLHYVGNKVAVVGEPFVLPLRATDYDQEPVQFSVTGLPGPATVTPGAVYGTAILNWTPGASDLGSYRATVTVTDEGHGTGVPAVDSETITLVVRSANAAPVITAVPTKIVREGERLQFTLNATDADGDTLTYSAENLPDGARLDPASGEFDWTPSYSSAGDYPNVKLIASDGQRSRFVTFTIFVQNVNQTPQIVPLAPQYGLEGWPLFFSVIAGDSDGDALVFSAADLPRGAQFDTATATFTWTPAYDQAGTHTVTVTATDPGGLEDSIQVELHVGNVNRPPVVNTSDHAVRLGDELRFFVQASDPDLCALAPQGSAQGEGDICAGLTYAGIDLPQGATLNPTTGEFIWRPGPGQTGEFLIGLSVSDGEATASQVIVIWAAIDPPAPSVLIELTPRFPVRPGSPVLIHVIADSLADITGLTATFDGQPLVLDAQGRTSVTPSALGKFSVTATATDADGLIGTATATLKVRDPNDTAAPVVVLDAAAGAPLLYDGVVTGTVRDANLDYWTLEIKRQGDDAFRTVVTGSQPVDGGQLAKLDVATMPNGFSVLRLTARDISGRSARAEAVIEVRTAAKRAYQLQETDLTVNLAGTTVTVARQYDSTRRDVTGKFGYGWRWLGRELDIRTNVPLTGQEDQGLYAPYRLGTLLYLSAPNGDEVGFRFSPVQQDTPGLTYYTPAWALLAESAAGWSLQTPGLKLMRAGGSFFELSTGRPYNPQSPFFEGEDFLLTAPDGTRYGVDATLGVISQTAPGGSTIYVGDSGLVAANGDAVQFVYDAAGRIERVAVPDGQVVVYAYSDQGDLVAARALATGASSRYGYDQATPHQLITAIGPTGAGTAIVYSATDQPAVLPVIGNLGTAANFAQRSVTGSLAAGASERHAFSIRTSEIKSTAASEVLVRVAVRATSGNLQPAVPQIPGLTPRSSFSGLGRADALFAISREGLYPLVVSSDAGTAGDYQLQVFIAGDVNADGLVDGVDSGLLAAAQGTREGQPGYVFAADLDGNGLIDATDTQILARNYGFRANAAPIVNGSLPSMLTHQGLELSVRLGDVATDADGDRLYYRIQSATHGTAKLNADGQALLFVPAPSYVGLATITVIADDGFQVSAAANLTVNVSDAPLLRFDIQNRLPRIELGETYQLVLVGDFADQQGVPLTGSYVTFSSSDSSVVSVTGTGLLTGFGEGTAVITASRGHLRAATAATVGIPDDMTDVFLFWAGLDVHPLALTLDSNDGSRQFSVRIGDQDDISAGTSGTVYVVGNSDVLAVTDDGLVTAVGTGDTKLTILNGPAEVVVPVRVATPHPGSGTVGVEGGLVQAAEGTILAIAPGALDHDVTVTVQPVSEADLEAPLPAGFEYVAAFNLDLGGQELNQPAELAVPVATGTPAGQRVYFLRQTHVVDPSGVGQDLWLVMETGIVGTDGIARTASPPYPGITVGGQWICAGAGTPETVTLAVEPPIFNSGAGVGVVIYDTTRGYGTFFSSFGSFIVPGASSSIPFEVWSYRDQNALDDTPYAVEHIDVTMPPGQTEVEVPVSIQSPPALPTPVIDFAVLSTGQSTIQLGGRGLDGATVLFRVGQTKFEEKASGTDTYVTVPVPRGVIVGLANIQAVNKDGTRSNVKRIPATGGLVFAAVSGENRGVAVFEKDRLKREIDVEFALDTAVTSDGARVYVATQTIGNGDGGIAVIDAMTLRLVDVAPTTAELDKIAFQGGRGVDVVAVDPMDHFLYAAGDSPDIYVIDIRPGSETFHQVVKTFALSDPTHPYSSLSRKRLAGLEVGPDGHRLYAALRSKEGGGYIVAVDLAPTQNLRTKQDWEDWKPSFAWFATEGLAPYRLFTTSDPNRVAFTYNYTASGMWQERVRIPVPIGLGWSVNIEFWESGRVGASYQLFRFGTLDMSRNVPVKDVKTTIGRHPLIHPLDMIHPGTNAYDGYFLSAQTPHDVVVLPDLSYAFVADWEWLGMTGYSGKRGDKVGVIKDPFGERPEFLGSTTPIVDGKVFTLGLTPDGMRLYVSYLGTQEVRVLDVPKLKAAANSRDVDRSETPLDKIPGGPIIHVASLSVPHAKGYSAQGYPLMVLDASGDDSPETVFQDGAVRVTYDLTAFPGLEGAVPNVTVAVLNLDGVQVAELGTYRSLYLTDQLINLDQPDGIDSLLKPGHYFVQARGELDNGAVVFSVRRPLTVLGSLTVIGDFRARTFEYKQVQTMGAVYFGQGGTDTLDLGLYRSKIASLNGQPLSDYASTTRKGLPVTGQAIYHGSSFDYLRLTDGREIYFQGIEQLEFSDGTIELQAHPNDSRFPDQWNLVVTDVPNAWRFTTGSSNVLLVSLDSGLPSQLNAVHDLAGRLDPDLDSYLAWNADANGDREPNEHGTKAISIMAAMGDNGSAIAGINWRSPVEVKRVYHGGITVTVIDDDGEMDRVTIVGDRPPVAENLRLSLSTTPIKEGEPVTLYCSFDDPLPVLFHTVKVDWGDGSPPTTETLEAGELEYSAQHTYQNNQPKNADYVINVTVTAAEGTTINGSIMVGVKNVGPSDLNVAINNVNGTRTVTGSFRDPGTLDKHTVKVDWGDGTETWTETLAPGVLDFESPPHPYLANPYFPGTNIGTAITDAMNYARSKQYQRVIFQGGIQGEAWLGSANWKKLLRDYEDNALFAIAAGNGSIDICETDEANASVKTEESGGVARLAGIYSNVIAVGALIAANAPLDGSNAFEFIDIGGQELRNATFVHRAKYSNFGKALTLMAPTDSPAVTSAGEVLSPEPNGAIFFNGTSAANPNMAGIASLVWSVNPGITAGELRQVLIDTAMDVGTPGRDDQTGYGLVNADAAVRRAYALALDLELAGLYTSNGYRFKDEEDVTSPGSLNPHPRCSPPSSTPAEAAFVPMSHVSNSDIAGTIDLQATSADTGLMDRSESQSHMTGLTRNDAAGAQFSTSEAIGLATSGTTSAVAKGIATASTHIGLLNGDFSLRDSSDTDFGWIARGNGTVVGGSGNLDESNSAFSGFSQSFIVPDDAKTLQFEIHSLNLCEDQGQPPDAFEVALLDASTMLPVVSAAAGMTQTDALLNVQPSGQTFVGSAVTVPGLDASGDTMSWDQPVTVQVDLTGVPVGTTAVLYFDLLGFGALDSRVEIDNVVIVGGNSPPQADAGGSYEIAEGASLPLDASASSDTDGDTLSYAWDLNGDGLFTDATGASPTLAWNELQALGLGDSGQYAVAVQVDDGQGGTDQATATLTVRNVAPTVMLAGPGEGTYGDMLEFTLGATDPSPVDQAAGFAYTIDWRDGSSVQQIPRNAGNGSNLPVSHQFTAAGEYSILVTAVDQDGDAGEPYSFTVTIHRAHLTLTAQNQTKVYGEPNPALTFTVTGFVAGDTLATSGITGAPVLTTAPADGHVGTYPITIAAGSLAAPNYDFQETHFVPGTLTVTPAGLTITADDKSKVYWAALPTLTASYVGFVNGDTAASLTTPPTLSTTAAAGSPVGSYPITVTGAVGADYEISYVPGKLTVVDCGWRNPVNPFDVNGDGHVTPQDVLLVINYINAHPDQTSLPSAPPSPPPFYNVNGDDAITPSDVLAVINYINAHPTGRFEGESLSRQDGDSSRKLSDGQLASLASNLVSLSVGNDSSWEPARIGPALVHRQPAGELAEPSLQPPVAVAARLGNLRAGEDHLVRRPTRPTEWPSELDFRELVEEELSSALEAIVDDIATAWAK
jgi:hypothetical protein